MRRLRGLRPLLTAATAALLAAGIGACSSSNAPSSGGGSTTTGPTLVISASANNTITQSFNPYDPTSGGSETASEGLIYEPLLQFNVLAPPQYYPWLATAYAWSDGGKTITFTIRQGVKWNNGSPLTPADVAFTFSLLKANPAMNLSGLDISSVSTSGNTVAVTFPTPQYANLINIGNTYILPKSIWSTIIHPETFTDPNPVGTGPYMLQTFTSEGFTLKKNPDFWQAASVKVPAVYYPVYTSGTTAAEALDTGQIQWAAFFLNNIQKTFIAPNPAHNHYWMAATGTNSLMPNLKVWPTNQLAVRQAISLAINRSLLASEGESGLEAAAVNSTGLTLPTFNAWAGPVANLTVSPADNAAAARQVLQKAGYTLGSNGYYSLNGKTVSLSITDPASFGDYALDDSIVAQDLKAAGIEATYQGVSVQSWETDVADGDFQLTLHWSTGSNPYFLYYNWLDSALATGQTASGDFERLDNPAIDADLAKVSTDQTVAEQTTDLVPVEQFVASNLPVIPTTTASGWFEYNDSSYTGWPTSQNAYELGEPVSPTLEVVLLHLRPKG
jgi:peptide/nickel transport system substrate-binding protein